MALVEFLSNISVLLFPIASMFAVGLSFTFTQIIRPLRYPDRVFRALVANFILVPLLALGISRLFAFDYSLTSAMALVGMAAGAPFLLKLTQVANSDVRLGASLLVILMPLTVVYMPLAVPLLIKGVSVNAIGIAVPLVLTMFLPLLIGHLLDSFFPQLAFRLQPVARQTSNIALVTIVVTTLVLNGSLFRGLFGTGAVMGAILLTAGGFGIGYLISSQGFNRRTVMGLGTGQRNIAAALVVASQDFDDPKMLTMIVLFSIVDLLVLFPIAMILRKRSTPPKSDAAQRPNTDDA
ncbi:MAG: transporter [Fibrobacter sp.]|mgnify:CR=1 FL=1|jgi:predicted Na+-dependent transporter|nr:transporter [Fibrobacter sp.]